MTETNEQEERLRKITRENDWEEWSNRMTGMIDQEKWPKKYQWEKNLNDREE